MTADEVLDACRATIGKPLNRLQTRIGFPRETGVGGPLFRAMAGEIGKHEWPSGPWFMVSLEQREQLERELGRAILASGDTLFGKILVTQIDSDEEAAVVFAQGEVAVDLRSIKAVQYSGWINTDAVRLVDCPKCNQAAGSNCRTPKGRGMYKPHVERVIRLRHEHPAAVEAARL